MSNKKRAGRPRKFDKNEALTAAMKTFWLKGYDGASLKDLTQAMGINGPSLYATFGDKKSLYLQAIRQYAENEACAPLLAFQSESDIYRAVRSFLEAVIEYATAQEGGARGCFLSSSVATSAGEMEDVQALLSKAIEDTDRRLAERFQEEVEKGCLPPDFPALERAQILLDLRQGFVFRARAGLSPEKLQEDLDYRVQIVLGPKLA